MTNCASISYISSSYIELTRTCHQSCGYCSFYRSDSPLLPIEELEQKIHEISRNNATEVIFISGESPQEYPHIQIDLHKNGFSSYADYLHEACQIALEANLLPVLSVGYLNAFNLKRFASSGCSVHLDLVASTLSEAGQALEKTRGRNPTNGKACLESLHNEQIPYSINFVVGIGESADDRLKFIEEIGRFCSSDPFLQDVRILPFQPSPGCAMKDRPPPSFDAIKSSIETAKKAFPVHHISVPPHLFSRFSELTQFGLNDLGSVPLLTGDVFNDTFAVPSFETLKHKLEKHNVHLYERGNLATPIATNRPEVKEAVAHCLEQIKGRNSAGLNLVDDEHCFVCGKRNQHGLHLDMKKAVENNTCTFTFTAGPTFQGYAGIVHGGILSTLLDEAMAHAVMGNKIMAVTADMHVRFLRPTPVGVPLKVAASLTGNRKNLYFARGTVMLDDGTLLAEAEGRFARI